jgi:hypothetical protein
MTAGTYCIVLHQPRDRRWEDLLNEWYVETVSEGLSLPPQVVIRLKPHVTADQANAIADEFRARLDGESVTVESRPR